jgi:hypothetical protein
MNIKTRAVGGKFINFELESSDTIIDSGLHTEKESIEKLEYLESVCDGLRYDIENMFGPIKTTES